MTAKILVVFVLAACVTASQSDSQFINSKCNQRSYGSDSFVCVCTAEQCDTIPRVKPSKGSLVQITSSMSGLRFAKTKKPLKTTDRGSPPAGPRIQVKRNTKFQEIFGFGGAFTDAATINIKALPEGAQEKLIRAYFAEDGIEYNMGRVPIAGSDFSTHTYSYADIPGDAQMDFFNLTIEDLHYKIPMIQKAMSVMPGPDELYLSGAAWSSPKWMKTSNSFSGFGLLKKEFYQAWADYHVRFLDAYAVHGLKFWSVSTGNEPLNGIVPILRFNSLGWTPSRHSAWIRNNLGPAIRKSVHNNTKILALDDQKVFLFHWLDWLLENNETQSYVDGIALHWYLDTFIGPGLLNTAHTKFPNKFLLYTEACVGSLPWEFRGPVLGSWQRAEKLIADMITVLNSWVTGWIDWNLALDLGGGPNWAKNFVDAPIIVNATAGEFYKQPLFYAHGHFSKFIPRKSVRIAAEASIQSSRETYEDDRVAATLVPLTTAFQRPDGSIAVVIFNKFDTAMQVELVDDEAGAALLDVPARSVSTVIYG